LRARELSNLNKLVFENIIGLENRDESRNYNTDITMSTCFVHNVPKTKHSGIQAKTIKTVVQELRLESG
jgi:hypothetical protein